MYEHYDTHTIPTPYFELCYASLAFNEQLLKFQTQISQVFFVLA